MVELFIWVTVGWVVLGMISWWATGEAPGADRCNCRGCNCRD